MVVFYKICSKFALFSRKKYFLRHQTGQKVLTRPYKYISVVLKDSFFISIEQYGML